MPSEGIRVSPLARALPLVAGVLVALVVGAIIARTFVEPAGGDENAEKDAIDEK